MEYVLLLTIHANLRSDRNALLELSLFYISL